MKSAGKPMTKTEMYLQGYRDALKAAARECVEMLNGHDVLSAQQRSAIRKLYGRIRALMPKGEGG